MEIELNQSEVNAIYIALSHYVEIRNFKQTTEFYKIINKLYNQFGSLSGR